MGRADYTENPIEQNGTGLMCGDEIVETRAESLDQPGVQSEWPLSFAQQRLWFVEQLEPGNAAYNMPLVARLTGALNVSAFQRALDAVVNRHESLRTRFVCVNGHATQVVGNDSRVKLRLEDLSVQTAADREIESKRRIRDEI